MPSGVLHSCFTGQCLNQGILKHLVSQHPESSLSCHRWAAWLYSCSLVKRLSSPPDRHRRMPQAYHSVRPKHNSTVYTLHVTGRMYSATCLVVLMNYNVGPTYAGTLLGLVLENVLQSSRSKKSLRDPKLQKSSKEPGWNCASASNRWADIEVGPLAARMEC
jgi:hypothetical protein